MEVVNRLKAKLFTRKLDFKSLKEILPTVKESEALLPFYESLAKCEDPTVDCVKEIQNIVVSQDIDNELLLLGAQTLWRLEDYENAAKLFIRVRLHQLLKI